MIPTIVLNPPRAVIGHPIEILEINADPKLFCWMVKLRISTADQSVETWLRYDKDKRITIDTIPESDKAYRLLLASRGTDPFNGPNPLAEAIEAAVRP